METKTPNISIWMPPMIGELRRATYDMSHECSGMYLALLISLYWSGPLRDIAEQAWVQGRQYSAEVWHEHFKREFLPDPDRADCDLSHVKDGFRKWCTTPGGICVLVGSTTGLTVRGMASYLEQVYAYGASLGVQFSERGR